MHELLHAFRTSSLFALAALAACGGDDQPEPTGPHYTYVVSGGTVPTSSAQVEQLAFDLDDNGTKDNQLGRLIDTLASQGFDPQKALNESLKKGTPILLVDLQTESFTSTAGAGFQVKVGQDPMPAACTNPDDITTCGKHLDGNGSFAVSTSSTASGAVAGPIVSSVFKGGPGELAFAIALGGMAVQFQLIGARVQASGISETGLTDVLVGGAISENDVNNKLIPTIYNQLAPIIDTDCPGSTPPDCGCASGSTGKTMISLFDTDPKDCNVTIDEIKNNGLISALLRADVTIDGTKAVSLGLKATAVKATIR